MAASRAMRRLVRVLELQEEQAQGELETAVGLLRRIENARTVAVERERQGRRLVTASAQSSELANQLIDRLAGLEETRRARQLAGVLRMRIAEVEREVTARREVFLAKRVARQQAETVVREAEARVALEAGRRGQQMLDEWFLRRRPGAEPDGSAAARWNGEDPRASRKKT